MGIGQLDRTLGKAEFQKKESENYRGWDLGSGRCRQTTTDSLMQVFRDSRNFLLPTAASNYELVVRSGLNSKYVPEASLAHSSFHRLSRFYGIVADPMFDMSRISNENLYVYAAYV
ncbi:unnamed protein product [Calypogeia fissa]